MTGKIVRSKAGHDKGQLFVITGVSDESGCVMIANGKTRRIENPKKKKLRHLEQTDKCMTVDETFTDRRIRETLGKLKADLI